MRRLLVLEGNPASTRQRAKEPGLRAGSELYCAALLGIDPTLRLDVVNAADAGATLPAGVALGDYDGVVMGGSALHAYDHVPDVERQLEWLLAAGDAGLPILGSCWGLQLAAVAAGGEVARNTRGREIGMARKIVPGAGNHPLLAGKGACYDALCIHYDDVTRLPPGAELLAANSHCAVQAAAFPLRRSTVWGLQYHPEFDIAQIAVLMLHYREDLLAQGFFADAAQCAAHIALWESLAANPSDAGLAWQLGLDADTLDDARRRREIANWLGARAG